MSVHRFEMAVSIDDERLAEHRGESKGLPSDPSEWEAIDLFLAAEVGLVDVRASEIIRRHRGQGVVSVTADLPIPDATYSVEWIVRGPVELSAAESEQPDH